MSQPANEPAEIDGSVHAIVFHNEENGYTIMQVKEATGGTVTVRGRIPAVVEGEQIRARGRWMRSLR